MEDKGDGHPFPALMKAVMSNADAARALEPMTFYRYAKGELPKVLEWFVNHPDVLAGLLEDARTMTPARRKKWKELIDKRADAQKDRRNKSKEPAAPTPKKRVKRNT